jgi:hypothetical protein
LFHACPPSTSLLSTGPTRPLPASPCLASIVALSIHPLPPPAAAPRTHSLRGLGRCDTGQEPCLLARAIQTMYPLHKKRRLPPHDCRPRLLALAVTGLTCAHCSRCYHRHSKSQFTHHTSQATLPCPCWPIFPLSITGPPCGGTRYLVADPCQPHSLDSIHKRQSHSSHHKDVTLFDAFRMSSHAFPMSSLQIRSSPSVISSFLMNSGKKHSSSSSSAYRVTWSSAY